MDCAADIIVIGDLVEVSLTQGPEEGAALRSESNGLPLAGIRRSGASIPSRSGAYDVVTGVRYARSDDIYALATQYVVMM